MARAVVEDSMRLIIDVYKGFRDELLASYGQIAATHKADHSRVTELDIKVEQTLKARLSEAFPDLGFQGEETGKVGNSELFWLVDPIDSTESFIRGLPNCTNMATLIEGRLPIAAVIYSFVDDKLYTAKKGEGAFCNDQPLHVSGRAVEVSYVDNSSSRIYSQVREVLVDEGVRTLQLVGAAGKTATLVAEGSLEGEIIINSLSAAHDRAPGMLLVSEAGGEVIAFEDEEWNIDSANYAIATPELAKLIRERRTDFRALIKDRTA